MKLNRYLLLGSFSIITALTGCGSDSDGNGSVKGVDYSGSTDAATITADNSSAIADSGIAVTKSLTQNESVDIPFGINISGSIPADVQKKLNAILKEHRTTGATSNLPVGATEAHEGSCGGSVTYSGDENSYSAIFNNYCESGTTMNGKMTGSQSGATETITFNNLSVSFDDETFVMSGTTTFTETSNGFTDSGDIEVTYNGETFSYSYTETCDNEDVCTYSENIKADNGTSYRVDDANVYGSDANGWDVEATLYDPTNGYVTYSASDILYCTDGSDHIESGSITLTDAENTLSIEFISCSEMTITFDGNSNTVAQ